MTYRLEVDTAMNCRPKKVEHRRLRVGDWRVIFTEDGTVIAIIKIAPRGGVYE